MNKTVKTLSAVVALLASSTALAGTQVWDFLGNGSSIENDNAHSIGSGTYIDLYVDNIELVISAWSSSKNSGSCSNGDPVCDSNNALYDQDPFIERAELTKYNGSGLGAINNDEGDTSPHHAFDNNGSNDGWVDYDMALLQFDTAVVLDEIDIGWRGDDSDMTVLSYTGNAAISGSPFGGSDTWYSLLSNGWSHVGNYADVSTSTNQVISGATASKYWLVGVYNPVFGESWSIGNDSIKLAGVKTSTVEGTPNTEVPEPTALALLLGGMALLTSRRRQS